MESIRCELTELIKNQCGHCKGTQTWQVEQDEIDSQNERDMHSLGDMMRRWESQ